jgi:serine/threonine protein kinase
MPRKAKPGQQIGKYEIVQLLNSGGMALAYAARIGREKFFLKQYKSPTTTVSWYKDYVKYQQELKRRVESTVAKNFSYRFVEFFEADFGGRTYFQVFEFVEGGHDLEAVLQAGRSNPKAIAWEQRLTLAKVLMAGINALHEAAIVHCDLKPPNIQLFKDPTITAGYRLKIIDMDFSVLPDRRAPWHGSEGYVGSPGYFSPEHLSGVPPQMESDVFTCGLILYELLTGHHPYQFDDVDAYRRAAERHQATKPLLLGDVSASVDKDQVADAIHRCLSPLPVNRPSAKEVNLALNGILSESASHPSRPTGRPSSMPSEPEAPPEVTREPTARTATRLELSTAGGILKFGVRTEVGKHLCTPLGEDAKFFATTQFVLDRDSNGFWCVLPNPAATNQTLLNGKAVVTAMKLRDGDVVAVGSQAKGIIKLPMTVHLA